MELTPAEKMYQTHLKNVANYQRRHAEKIQKKQREWLLKVKEDPERYEALKERRREYHKKRKEAIKALMVQYPDATITEITPTERIPVGLPAITSPVECVPLPAAPKYVGENGEIGIMWNGQIIYPK